MSRPRLRGRTVGPAVALVILLASAAEADDVFDFEWRATLTVTRWVGPGAAPAEVTSQNERAGRGVLTVARGVSSDTPAAFTFRGPDGGGSGSVGPGAPGRVDPNVAFPSPVDTALPPPDPRTIDGSFRNTGSAVDIVYSETFVCRATPTACGNVKRWERTFVGTGHAAASTAAPH